MTEPMKFSNAMYPVGDVAAAAEFFHEVLGFPVSFVDGERFAAPDCGGVTLALAGPEEAIAGGLVAASVRVEDLADTVRQVVSRGGTVLRELEDGPHETRAVVNDPWGNPLVLYRRR